MFRVCVALLFITTELGIEMGLRWLPWLSRFWKLSLSNWLRSKFNWERRCSSNKQQWWNNGFCVWMLQERLWYCTKDSWEDRKIQTRWKIDHNYGEIVHVHHSHPVLGVNAFAATVCADNKRVGWRSLAFVTCKPGINFGQPLTILASGSPSSWALLTWDLSSSWLGNNWRLEGGFEMLACKIVIFFLSCLYWTWVDL